MGIYNEIMEWYNSFFEPVESEIKTWDTDIKRWDRFSLDDAKFIFAQAEKLLDDTIKNYDATTTKSFSILTIINGILAAQITYIFIKFDPQGIFDIKLTTVFVASGYLFYSTFSLIKNILPNRYRVIGSPPDKLFLNVFFDNENPKEIRTSQIYRIEILSYNTRIYFNMSLNARRLNQFTAATIRLIIYPVVCLITYLVILCCYWCYHWGSCLSSCTS